jgi:hypothetical protein
MGKGKGGIEGFERVLGLNLIPQKLGLGGSCLIAPLGTPFNLHLTPHENSDRPGSLL